MAEWWGRWQKDLAPGKSVASSKDSSNWCGVAAVAGLPWEICGVYASLGPEEREKERVEKLVEELVYRRLQVGVHIAFSCLKSY